MKPATVPVAIEPARPADEAAVRGLLQQAALPHEDFAAHLRHFLVARREGVAVGAVGFELHGTDALLRSLVVAPEWRAAGLGGELVRRLEETARRAGVRHFYLLTTTAEAFFARRLFEKIERESVPAALAATPEFQSLCPVSAMCMARPVSP